MIIKLKCNECEAEFKIIFDNKNEDDSYYAVCPNCGNTGYTALDEIEIKRS
ncbi:hypothetical protein H1057_17285 [Clostridium sporogenes]|uniref:hypothetical protein n=1 Tax=Clostridium sporogenes TaxID=1509 RepID=UPI0015EF42F9|nr:hypothetical protein [Clostridium sporogenes]MBA4509778.1 hypothetical protein [Clostridium sporogenes]